MLGFALLNPTYRWISDFSLENKSALPFLRGVRGNLPGFKLNKIEFSDIL
jgi:hypothetical protein